MNILVLDNYDSFTYNIVHILKKIEHTNIDVIRNDKIELTTVINYDKIILSPGPSLPKDAGKMPSLIRKYYKTKSILGICLGHQAIGENFGGKLFNLDEPYHGIQTEISIKKDYLFDGISNKILACRYHSWAISADNFPENLKVIATDSDNMIMGISHNYFDVKGIQFHPESVQTNEGSKIIKNFINN